MAQSFQPEINCIICNKPVTLETSKTDANGKAVHEECYTLREALKQATRLPPQPPAS